MSDLTPGDPLSGGSRPSPPPPPRPRAPEIPGYTHAPPPGAGGPAPDVATFGGQYVLSGWWRRVGAHLIDGVIVLVGALILIFAITAPFSIGFFAGDEIGVVSIIVGLLIAILCVCIVALLYAPAMMARTNGRTIGRMATGIRVVRANGQPITFGFAMLREVAVKWLLFQMVLGSITAGIAVLVDFLWPLWDEENRALHDFLVDTRTVLD
jgi:uncharacterized RDD family membrane protein YckC